MWSQKLLDFPYANSVEELWLKSESIWQSLGRKRKQHETAGLSKTLHPRNQRLKRQESKQGMWEGKRRNGSVGSTLRTGQTRTAINNNWWGTMLEREKQKIKCQSISFPKVKFMTVKISSVQFTQWCPTLCDPMNRSTPDLAVHHKIPEFTQTHAHRVGDAIQPSHPLSSSSPPAHNPSQHQGLFQWVNSSHEMAKVLEFQLQHQSFQWTPRTDLL